MKRNYDMKQGIFVFLMAMGTLLLASCEADPVATTRGELPDKEPLENTYVSVRSQFSPVERSAVYLVDGTGTTSDPLFCRLNRPAETDLPLQTPPDDSQADNHNT